MFKFAGGADEVLMNFIRSTAAYSLVCCLLQALSHLKATDGRGSVPRSGQTSALLIGPTEREGHSESLRY